jgi:tetratricopeptide (TPR) repeat protein
MKRSVLLILICAVAATTQAQEKRQILPRPGLLDEVRFKSYGTPRDLPIVKGIAAIEALYKKKEYAKAMESAKALRAMPGTQSIHTWLQYMEGLCLMNTERFDEARAAFAAVIAANPKSADATLADYDIGSSYKLAYDDDKALAHYDTFLDNPDRRSDGELYNRVLQWQTEQYKGRNMANPSDLAVEKRCMFLLEVWVKAHPDQMGEWSALYRYHRKKKDWPACERVASLRMKPPEAALHVLMDRMVLLQETSTASSLGQAAARNAAKPELDAIVAAIDRLPNPTESVARQIRFQIVQTMLMCGMPDEGDAAAADWMKRNPVDRTALYMYIGHVRATKGARPAVLDTLVDDYLSGKPADDVRREILTLYADVALTFYPDRSQAEKLLLKHDAPPTAMARFYGDTNPEKAEPAYLKVTDDATATEDMRFQSLSWLGNRRFAAQQFDEATNYYSRALAMDPTWRRFAATSELMRDRLAQVLHRNGESAAANELWSQNMRSRDTELVTRANLMLGSKGMASREPAALFNAERLLRNVVGQYERSGQWTLGVSLSTNPVIRAMQDQAQETCVKHGVKLDQPPNQQYWFEKIRLENKADYEKRLRGN